MTGMHALWMCLMCHVAAAGVDDAQLERMASDEEEEDGVLRDVML